MDKKVDENWKEQVEREKKAPRQDGGGKAGDRSREPQRAPDPEAAVPSGDFAAFLSTLSYQALMALGEMPNPVTQQPQEDLEQARYLIDVLGMLQLKTKGNLTAQEGSLLEGLLYELRMKYVAKNQGGASP